MKGFGIALLTVGTREKDTVQLQEAVAALREALKENTPTHVPLEYGLTSGWLGASMTRLAERNRDADLAKDAYEMIEIAYKLLVEEGDVSNANLFQGWPLEADQVRASLRNKWLNM